jgi:hypothetical protein
VFWKQELYFKKKKLAANAPCVVTLATPPICMALEMAVAEVTRTPLRVPLAYPEKDANPPTAPVFASKRHVKVAWEPALIVWEAGVQAEWEETWAVPLTWGVLRIIETPVAVTVARL